MSLTPHVFPLWVNSYTGADLATNTYKVLLIASTSNALTWNSTLQNVATVTEFLAGSGAGSLTEVSTSETGYSRLSLTTGDMSVIQTSSANSTSPAYMTLKYTGTMAWSSSTISATYAMWYDYTAGGGGGSDTLGVPAFFWDFGASQSTSSATFTLQAATSAGASIADSLVEWTVN